MIRKIQIAGNLAADPEILTDKNGTNYMRIRVGNRIFGDAENDTHWYDVTMFSVPRIAQHLKKGSGVIVGGTYKDSIYSSEKYGPQINRNITADYIEFWNTGQKREEGAQAPEQKPAAAPANTPAAEAKPKASKAKATKAASYSVPPAPTVDNDDLPF